MINCLIFLLILNFVMYIIYDVKLIILTYKFK